MKILKVNSAVYWLLMVS